MQRVDMALGNPKELQEIQVADSILQDFKGLDCSSCNQHFGYQSRVHPNYLFCSPQCLSVGKHAIGQLSPIPLTPPAHSGTSCDKEHVIGFIKGRNSGSNRGGRGGGGNIVRNLVRPGRGCYDSPFYRAPRSDSGEDFVDRGGVGSQPLKDLTEQALNDAFEKNTRKSNGFATVEQQEETRSAFLAAARKPHVPNDENSSSQKSKTVTASASTQKQLNPPKQEDKPTVPVIHPIKPVATVKASPDKIQSSETAPLPKLVAIKRPGSGQAAGAKTVAPVIPKPIIAKKIWTVGNLPYSISLVNMAPCNVAYVWGITKYHLQAQADESNLEALQTAVAKYSNGAPAITRVPSINDIVFAPYENEYYRGKVTSVDQPGGTINVFFIDYGAEQKVKLTDCREPLEELMSRHPIYGVVFSLTLDVDLPESIKKAPVPADIMTATEENSVYMTVEEQLNDHFTGKLHIDENKTFNDMVKDIIKKAAPAPTTVAAPIKSDSASPEVPRQSSQTPPPRSSSRAPFPVIVGQKPPTPTIPAAKWTIQKAKFSEHLETSTLVHPSYVWNLSKLNITADADLTNLEYLQAAINKFVPTAPGMTRAPQIDEIVLAPYDGTYYRGRVAGIEGSDVHVVFLDYGDEAMVKPSEIKEPSDEIMKHPFYGVCIRMLDVPEDVALIETPAIEAATDGGGQIEITSQNDNKLWTGKLWIAGDKTWSDLANEAIKSQGK